MNGGDKYYGLYRGTVVNNIDPMQLGQCRVRQGFFGAQIARPTDIMRLPVQREAFAGRGRLQHLAAFSDHLRAGSIARNHRDAIGLAACGTARRACLGRGAFIHEEPLSTPAVF